MGVSAASAAHSCLTLSADGTTVTGSNGCTVLTAADWGTATRIADGDSSSYVFKNSKDTLTSIEFPSDFQSIGSFAFYACFELLAVDMSETSLTTIADSAFSGDYRLTSISFPSTLITFGSGVFSGCFGLQSIDFSGTSLTTIPSNAFGGLSGLTSVSFPATLTTIGSSAFGGCTGLRTIDLSGTSVWLIEEAAFAGLSLSNVTLPSTLTTIHESAFAGNTYLEKIVLPSSVTAISPNAFDYDSASILFLNKSAAVNTNAFRSNTVYGYADSSWWNDGSGTKVALIDTISAADITIPVGDSDTVMITSDQSASNAYIPSITYASSNTAIAAPLSASTAKGVMTNTINGLADGTVTLTITAAQVGSDIFGAAAVPAIDPITVTVTVGSGGPNIPDTGGEGGVSDIQNGSDLAQYEAAVYAAPVVSANGNTALVITNTHYPELINVSVVKVWEDDDDRDHYRPDAICITLTAAANNVEEEVWNYSLSATNANASDANRWEYTFDDMVKFYDGYQIAYTLDEDSGSCAAQVTKTAANCEISGGRWENSDCTPFSLYNPNSQQSSPATYNDQSSCETAGYTWIAASCSDNTYQDQSTCDANGETWTAAHCQTN